MIYLYGLADIPEADARAALSGQDGLAGPLQLIKAGRWTLIYSPHPDEEVLPKRRLMLIHTRVLERLIGIGTVLPARFGLLAETPDQAVQLIADQTARVTTQFEDVSGCVEIGLRVAFPKQAALEATLAGNPGLSQERKTLLARGPEAQYALAAFGGRLAEELDRRRGTAQKQMLTELAPLVRNHVLRLPEADTEVLRAEFLIDAQQQEHFVSRAGEIAAALDFAPGSEPAITVIGPVPMYHFVRLSLAPETESAAA